MKLEFHHINYVSTNVDELNKFYIEVLGLTKVPAENFVRTEADKNNGYDGNIKFVTVAVWSNFVAHKPVIKPKLPIKNDPKKAAYKI